MRLDEARSIESSLQADAEQRQETNLANFNQDLRAAELHKKGPPAIDYDYQGAYLNGTEFKGGSEGTNLPNSFLVDAVVNGQDIKTGAKVVNTDDPDEMGGKAAERLGKSYVNTEQGMPVEDYEPLVYSALHHLQNGGNRDNYDAPFPKEPVQTAFDTAEALVTVRGIERQLEAMPAALAPEREPLESGSLTQDDLQQDTEFLDAARTVAEYLGAEFDDDLELVEAAVEEIGLLRSSTYKMAATIYGAESGDLPSEVADAYLQLMYKYEGLSMLDPDVVQSNLVGIVTDPGTYLLGGASNLLLKGMGKSGALQLMKGKLLQAAGAGATIGAAEGAAVGGLTEMSTQALQGEYDAGGVLTMAGFGALAGGVLGGGFAGLLSEPGRAGIRHTYQYIADNWANQPGTRRAQRGSLDFRAKQQAQLDPRNMEVKDFGQVMADTRDGQQFYSRLTLAVDDIWQKNFGNKAVSPARVDDMLAAWQKKGAFSEYELENMGLRIWLSDKADAGESVAYTEIQDFMYANRPRVSALVSGVGDYKSPGTESYKDLDPRDLRSRIAASVIIDKYMDMTRREIPADTARIDAMVSEYVSEVLDVAEWNRAAYRMQVRGNVYPEDIIRPEMPSFPEEFMEIEGAPVALGSFANRHMDAARLGKTAEVDIPVIRPEPEYEFIVTNSLTGEVRSHPSAAVAQRQALDMARDISYAMSDEQLITFMRATDVEKILAPPRWGGENAYNVSTITGGNNQNNYREMRLFLPYDGVRNVENVAVERFGDTYANLNATNQKRAQRIVDFATKPRKEMGFREALHFPLEYNRLTHIRMQDLYAPDGTKVLAINEMQADIAKPTMRKHPLAEKVREIDEEMAALQKRVADAGYPPIVAQNIIEDAQSGYADIQITREDVVSTHGDVGQPFWDEVEEFLNLVEDVGATRNMVDWQPIEAHEIMTLNRLLQYATENGYTAIAFPNDRKMLRRIEGWGEQYQGRGAEGLFEFYSQKIPRLLKDKKMVKRWGLDSRGGISLPVQSQPQGGEVFEEMNIFTINPKKAEKGPKAIYGIAGLATASGSHMLSPGEGEEEL